MITIFELLTQEENLVKEISELRLEVVEKERLRELDEGNAWTMDFKAIGATSDKMRAAAVKRKMNQFPNTAAQKKAELFNKELELKSIRNKISVMKEFKIESFDFEEEDKDEEKEES